MSDTLRHWLLYWGCYVFGICTGALIEINHYEHLTAKSVVTVEQDGASHAAKRAPGLQPSDAAPPLAQVEAEKVRHFQRVQELRFSLAKEERLQKERFAEAVTNRDSIREMVAKLGEVQR